MQQVLVLIVGASIAGLSLAASLKKKGIAYIIIEKESQVATPWRNHYQRLHLHTNKSLSNLPYKKFDSTVPRYPSRQQVVDYLDAYQKEFSIHPIFNTEALSIQKEKESWIIDTNNGRFTSSYVIIATGAFSKPRPIYFKGMETFTGKILHSYGYKTGKDFTGLQVLVAGFGNSACEIAIDLYEQGAMPSMAVRSPVNVLPRDIAGIPVLQLSLLMRFLPTRVADAINAPLIRLLVGNITKLGLRQKQIGPLTQIKKEGTVPLLDIGTIGHIRQKHIQVYGGISRIEAGKIYFTDGRSARFDVIIAAIGYHRADETLIKVGQERFVDLKLPLGKQKYFGKDGLYFCGFWIAPTGQIREIALDAQKIAEDIAEKEKMV